MNNANTLRITISRFVRMGLLHRIQRGLYSSVPLSQIDAMHMGSAMLHRYCYVSTETVLRDAGIILQDITTITMISSVSRQWQILDSTFRSRKLQQRFLQNTEGITLENGIYRASPIRAIADILYFDPWYTFDTALSWKKVKTMQRKIGYPLHIHKRKCHPDDH